jgi:hypothetical protein
MRPFAAFPHGPAVAATFGGPRHQLAAEVNPMATMKNLFRWFDGWRGFEPKKYSGDYHTGVEGHLPLEQLAEKVAKEQSPSGEKPRQSVS